MRGGYRALPGLIALMVLAQCVAVVPIRAPSVAQPVSSAPLPESGGGQILNDLRQQNGRAAIPPNAALTRAAMAHAQDMAANNFLGHTGSNGSSLRDRTRQQGYKACWIAENVAKGQSSASEVMNQWMGSGSHRKNMLNGKAAEYGLARGPGNAWVLVLARPGC